MTIIYILIGFGVGYWIAGRFFGRKKGNLTNDEREKKAKEARGRVMKLFNGKSEITNNNVEELLGVSDATATNYLDELERQGRITQVGRTGRFVYYKRN